MWLYVHIAEDCEAEAQKHGQASLVANIKAQVEATQSLTGFTFFLPTPFIKKSLGRSFRLIGYRATVDGDELILFLRVFARGGKEYKAFLEDWDKETDRISRTLQPFNDVDLRQIHTQLSSVAPLQPPPEPDEEERAWLYEVFREQTSTDELLVLETDAWVKKMRSPAMRDFLALYHQALEQLDLDAPAPETSNFECSVYWETSKRVGLAYLYLPNLHRLILLEPLRQSDDVNAILQHHKERLLRVDATARDISCVAGRSYPYLMILDQDAWLAIQKDEEANLALSPEEAELLESIRRSGAAGEYGYPLFINGRAGSGKSTMLQYLAADYVDFALRCSTKILPIYMTCSRELLERARETVRGLLTAHHERLLDGIHATEDVDRILKESFVVFQEYLYSLLPPNDREALARDRYVNFAEFRRLWATDFAKRPEARRITPEVSWHTIRSYIKGVRSSQSDDLDPEEFAALPRRRRSVSEDTYRQVYDHVWCRWYKRLCEDNGYWDDQDLAARVLDADTARTTDLAAVFCDEAQDFTPVELEIIFQLSVFSKRSLQPEELRRVPIVFAGDPLQTINPTGFRWEAVQADFHERFCAALDPRRRARVDVSYKELRLNYRSNPGIVRFCNLIQLVRAALLGSRDVHPQQAWWVEEPAQTVWFAIDNAPTKQQIQQRPELVKLLNCEEGEESDYARADSILKDLKEESDGVYRNVLGPTRAKGLEFSAVVLYRFAETAPPEFLALLAGTNDVRDDPERQLPLEYFFNRLYVAASRAKGQLVIVDSGAAFDGFWRFATDTDLTDRLMERVEDPESWKDAINYLVRGREESWSGERIDPREQGSEYAAQGRRKRDPYLLRQAALAYRSAGDELEAGRCLALALEFEGKLQDAGDRYRALSLRDEAFRCYWKGAHFARLCDLAAAEPIFASRLETRAADFTARGTGVQGVFVSEVVRAVGDVTWRGEVASDATWRHVFAKLAERLAKAIGQKSVPWAESYAMLKHLSQEGVAIEGQHLAMIAYGAGEHGDAVAIWERVGGSERDEYRRAKAHLAPFPDNITWFSRLKEHEEVLSQWHAHRANVPNVAALSEAVTLAVVDAAIEKADLHLAAELLERKADRDRVAKLLSEATKRGDAANALAGALIGIRLLVASRSWTAAIRVADASDFSELVKREAPELKTLLRRGDGAATLFRAVVEELAESTELALESADRQGPVAEFLHRTFIGKDASAVRQRGVAPEAVGAAIERAGKIVDALQFYEALGRDPTSSEDVKRFAAERLVRNLQRHADWFRGKGDERQARERDARANSGRETLGLGKRQLPDYPGVPRRTAAVEPSEWTRRPFRFVLSRPHGRLRIEHSERFETVTVYANERQLHGDAAFDPLAPTDSAVAVWLIPGWEMTIRLVGESSHYVVSASFGGERFEVGI